ncbi:hydroxyacid dehydrogenase [Paenibacillus qinlingensis]|uniref:hydroxyacid dehydrogenase n=1 Tax=Paenibacillus qinlingensis TaxID=1837343 RepID=UPI00156763E3|nr:hydroxyacid dehydrogenase [Paenibacillus qinlingensis]NQX62772.1 hydroxyacid dehydrogenase [Paenibacillus qinlingensis]
MRALVTVSDPFLRGLIFQEETIQQLNALCEVDWTDEHVDSDQLAERIGDYDICITSWGSAKLDAGVLGRAHKLKFIGHAAGTVVPMVDPLVYELDMTVVNANTSLARSTAELAVALMLHGSWDLSGYSQRLKQGGWTQNNRESVKGLYRQTIGLIGYGEISREVIRLLQPYEAEILLYSGNCSTEEAQELGVKLCSLEEVLSRSAIVSLHNTLTEKTRGMLGAKELSLLPDGALLVNTARGPIIEEEALLNELTSERISAALDVFDMEPLPKGHPLLQLSNAYCFPHIGGFNHYWKSKLGLLVVEDLARWINGEELHGEINQVKFQRQTLPS